MPDFVFGLWQAFIDYFVQCIANLFVLVVLFIVVCSNIGVHVVIIARWFGDCKIVKIKNTLYNKIYGG